MEKKDVLKRKAKEDQRINLMISVKASKWAKENSVSPQAVLNKAFEELMDEDKEDNIDVNKLTDL